MAVRRVALAGSSGSVGTQTIDVVAASDGRFEITAIAVGASVEVAIRQARRLDVEMVAVADRDGRARVAEALPGVEVVADAAEIVEAADIVVNAVVGFGGLGVTVATLEAGKRLALANKESLIAAGPVVQPLRATPGAELVPVDSEHCALHQCLRSSSSPAREVERLVLTASGGPFRGRSAADLAGVTIADALAHPTWTMGPKITVDSSTLMNKGLEVIEARELFGVDYDRIGVVVHPQSIVHSMVSFVDGSTIAQLSRPDMRLPIGYALGYPERLDVAYGAMDFAQAQRLEFEPPDLETFRCLALAFEAGRAGDSAPATLSGANEVAVEAFLAGGISWTQIAEVDEAVLSAHDVHALGSVDDVIDADARARDAARKVIAGIST